MGKSEKERAIIGFNIFLVKIGLNALAIAVKLILEEIIWNLRFHQFNFNFLYFIEYKKNRRKRIK